MSLTATPTQRDLPANRCYHLQAGGYPSTWTVVAIYRDAYGIAFNAAKSWYARDENLSDIRSQFVIQINNGRIYRSDLFLDEHHFADRQTHDRPAMLVQWHSSPCELPPDHQTLVEQELRQALFHANFMIPYEQWAQKYPDDLEIVRAISNMLKAPRSGEK